jgi:hypothetical protein
LLTCCEPFSHTTLVSRSGCIEFEGAGITKNAKKQEKNAQFLGRFCAKNRVLSKQESPFSPISTVRLCYEAIASTGDTAPESHAFSGSG